MGDNVIGLPGQIITPLSAAAFLALIYAAKATAKISQGTIIAACFCSANAIMLITLLTFETQPTSDYSAIWDMAKSMAASTYDIKSMKAWDYRYIYNWQTGMALVESLIIRLFGESFGALQAVNLIAINATLILSYRLATIVGDKRSATMTLVLMSCFYPMLVSVGQLSNQNLVAPLILWFISLLTKRRYFAAGLLTPIISFIRPVGIILLLTAIVLFISKTKFTKESLTSSVKATLLFLIPYFVVNYAIDSTVMAAGYTDTPVSSAKIPYYKFHRGVEGGYAPFVPIMESGGDLETYNQWEKQQVINAYRPKNLANTLLSNTKKMVLYLGWFDWKFEMTYNQNAANYDKGLISECVAIGWGEYIALLILTFLGYKGYVKRNGIDALGILLLGITCVYFFIEAWTSYRYESYPLMFVIAGWGALRLQSFKAPFINLKAKKS